MSVYSSLSAVTLPESSSSLVTLSGDQISIGDLGFTEIKQSIISSLKRTAEDSDYDKFSKSGCFHEWCWSINS